MSEVLIQNISKTYGDKQALQNINIHVGAGELFGLIGPDGAGKTSLFRILTTLILPDSGEAQINGFHVIKDFKEIRKCVGYMPGKFSLYQDLSVEENLNFFATVYHTTVAENYELIKDIYVQLEPFKHRRAGKLSGGMKQKLALCCALIHRPTILFLDEPTTGVDAVSRREFWEMLKRLKKEGITIFVSTPYMDEAKLCERIALIQDGKILSVDTPAAVKAQYPKPLFAIRSDKMSLLLGNLRSRSEVRSCNAFGDYLHISMEGPEALARLVDDLRSEGVQSIEAHAIDPTIEDCFIELMQQ